MIVTRWTSALTIATGVALSCSAARADDTVRLLAGAGSFNNSASARTITLQGNGTTDAETSPVCCWRKWCYGYCAPVCPPVVYAAPAYYTPPYHYAPPAPATLPPPTGGPAAYYYQPSRLPLATAAIAPRLSGTRPTIVVGYQGRFFNGALTLRPGARIAANAAPTAMDRTEMAPPPQSDDTYRYDGGPSRPVPMPVPDPVSPVDPVPTTVPALYRVQNERSHIKVPYPAYGERPASRPANADPVLVKRTGN